MFEPLPLWFEKTGATLLIGLPLLFANLKYEKNSLNRLKKKLVKSFLSVVVGGSIFEPLPLWSEKTGATELIGLPLLFANLK